MGYINRCTCIYYDIDKYSDFLSDTLSGIYSDICWAYMLTFFLIVYIAQFDLAFFVASILAFHLASYLTFYSASVYLASILVFFSGILSGIYYLIFFPDILFCHSILSFYLAFHLKFHSGIHLTHWDLALAVEVRQCPLRSRACSWVETCSLGGEGGDAHRQAGKRIKTN